jgi:hypothetical protein
MTGAVEPEQASSKLWRLLMSKGLESTGKIHYQSGEELPCERDVWWSVCANGMDSLEAVLKRVRRHER